MGKTWGVSKKLLLGCVFILSGIFNKVNTHREIAEEGTKKMITLFKGEVKRSFSKNPTTYLQARALIQVQSRV